MKILFWNTHKNTKINKYIKQVVVDNNIDIVALAEYADDIKEFCNGMAGNGLVFHEYITFGCERITMAGLYQYSCIKPGMQRKYYSIQIINEDYILCALHLMSDLKGDFSQERYNILREIASNIEELKKEIGTNKVLCIGDFNEMPYGEGCLSADALHGLPYYDESEDNTRTVSGKEYPKYYNPMWNLLGDFCYPPGTCYYNTGKLKNTMWHMVDQVIISRELVPSLVKKNVRIITECGLGSLANKRGFPNNDISDHFPIIVELKEEG